MCATQIMRGRPNPKVRRFEDAACEKEEEGRGLCEDPEEMICPPRRELSPGTLHPDEDVLQPQDWEKCLLLKSPTYRMYCMRAAGADWGKSVLTKAKFTK